jgi:Flp pilus assembly pilin Flp
MNDQTTRVLSRLRRLWTDRRGVSAVEFAIIASVMVTLMLGAFDFGNAAQEQIALQAAVRAGGEYALHFPTNPAAVQTVVTSALPTGWQLSNPGGQPIVTCSCGGVSGTFDCSAPPATCAPPMLVSITATMPYVALSPLFGAAIPSNTANYVARFK